MNDDLFHAILSMDAYNRGIGANIFIDSNAIGHATIYKDTADFVSIASESVLQGFYAVSYDYNGTKVISYRGTDDPLGGYIWDGDLWNGWLIGGGLVHNNQAELAFQFYQEVVGGIENAFSSDVSFTGYSLGYSDYSKDMYPSSSPSKLPADCSSSTRRYPWGLRIQS